MKLEDAIDALHHSGKAIAALLAHLPEDRARQRPAADEWSLLEVACHLLDEEREDFRVRIEYTLDRREEPFPPIDPAGWPESRGYLERDLDETLADFHTEREASLVFLAGLQDADWDTAKDMAFGPLRAGDILASWVAHDLLHLRQLVALRYEDLETHAAPYVLLYAGGW